MKLQEDLIIEQALTILEQRIRQQGICLKEPNDVRRFLMLNFAEKEHEVFGLMLLDTRHCLISFEAPFQGTIDGAGIYPRELVKLCLARNAKAVILCHNHPSCDPRPSQADERITQRIVDALTLIDVQVLDHFVIGGMQAYSFAESGLLWHRNGSATRLSSFLCDQIRQANFPDAFRHSELIIVSDEIISLFRNGSRYMNRIS